MWHCDMWQCDLWQCDRPEWWWHVVCHGWSLCSETADNVTMWQCDSVTCVSVTCVSVTCDMWQSDNVTVWQCDKWQTWVVMACGVSWLIFVQWDSRQCDNVTCDSVTCVSVTCDMWHVTVWQCNSVTSDRPEWWWRVVCPGWSLCSETAVSHAMTTQSSQSVNK